MTPKLLAFGALMALVASAAVLAVMAVLSDDAFTVVRILSLAGVVFAVWLVVTLIGQRSR
jgi:uncharacterized membrane protein